MGFRLLLIVGLLVSLQLTAGCESMSHLMPKRGTTGRIARPHSNKPPLFSRSKSNSIDKLVKNNKRKSGSNGLIAKATAPAAALGEKLKHASATLSNELAIKPKDARVGDPVSLATKPTNINVDVYYTAARLADNRGDVDEALKQYHRGLEVAPEHLPSLISVARLHDRQNQFAEAVQFYRQAMAVAPDNATIHNDLGLCFARQLRNEEALVELQQAIRIDPAKKLYRNNVAAVMVAMGRIDQAHAELQNVYPPAVAYYNLGFLLERNGHKVEAQQQVARACQADPSLAPARQMLQQLNAELNRVATNPAMSDRQPADPAARSSNVFAPVSTRYDAIPMRRTPPTQSATPNPSIELPLTPSLRDGASTPSPAAKPLLQFPVRRVANYSVDQEDDSISLPTPSRVEPTGKALPIAPGQPRLLPVANSQ